MRRRTLILGCILAVIFPYTIGNGNTITNENSIGRNSLGSGNSIAGTDRTSKPISPFLFDDFNYSNSDQMAAHGWTIRTTAGWPGLEGAVWRKEGISFQDDPALPGNRIVRMTSYTNGEGRGTQQSQICHERKYREGTYAARVRFSDMPVSGPDGDQIVESFYTICPLKAPMDPDYSELDFEYLPHGGWGKTGATLFVTSWFTFSPEPHWKQVNTSNSIAGSQSGWHTLVTQVAAGKV
ncbi:MAG TPA: glycoside hydrolase family 16 protein, partial [Blastocatellia bacterium]|nr:glycoside hydrolase family 16 protein [Blastocatellia bacterium]